MDIGKIEQVVVLVDLDETPAPEEQVVESVPVAEPVAVEAPAELVTAK